MNSVRRAFTLIELLVVIAIIAILAAILFPVFAQAKASAKKIAVLSQYKQAGTASAIYFSDSDDTALVGSYSMIGSSIVSPRTGATITNPTYTWAQLAQPYMKNWPLLNDRSVADPLNVWADSTPPQWWYNWDRWPALGYNVNYLNASKADCSDFGSTEPGLTQFGRPISMTSIASPSGTVMFESVKRVGGGGSAYTSYDAESPGSYNANDTCSWSNGGWGIGSYGDSTGTLTYPGNPTSTGDFATPYANQGVIVFTDSSAKSLPAGKVAAGTNWKVGIANSAIQITDRTQYIWDTQQ
jgi:prepilin-type N-terminal cleavage/methylation domain-containing protein